MASEKASFDSVKTGKSWEGLLLGTGAVVESSSGQPQEVKGALQVCITGGLFFQHPETPVETAKPSMPNPWSQTAQSQCLVGFHEPQQCIRKRGGIGPSRIQVVEGL